MAKIRRSKLDAVLKQLASLSQEELEELRQHISQTCPELLQLGASPSREAPHSAMELKGLGKEFWRSIDVDAYLEEERDSWSS